MTYYTHFPLIVPKFESESCQLVQLKLHNQIALFVPTILSAPAWYIVQHNIVQHKGRQAIQMKESTFEGESGCCNMFCQSVCVSKAP